VLIVEAEKQVYGMTALQAQPARRRRPLVVVPSRPAVARPKLGRSTLPDA
jgi:hypothetical protein